MTRTAVANDPGDNEWLSTVDAARLLGVTPRTLYRYIDCGELPAHRLGRIVRIRRDDLERFEESVRRDPPDEM